MKYDKINTLLNNLLSEKDEFKIIDIGINLSNEILILLGAPLNELKYGEDAKDAAFSNSRFKNQKMETWFSKHPYLSQARVAIDLFNSNSVPIKSNFFKLSDSSNKAKISASTQLDVNWEDNELTRKPQYKVGIDFFIKHEENSLLVVVTNRGNLRVLELSEKLSNTQIEIFDNISNCFKFTGIDPKTGVRDEFEPQRTIHKNLWDALALQSVNKKFYTGIAENFQVLVQHIESNLPVGLKQLESSNDIKLFSTRLLGRLLFLWFLKKKHIINKEIGYFDLENLNSSDYYERKLKVLFFQTLNTPIKDRTTVDLKTPYLNGGLFDPHPNDWAEYKVSFPITWFKELYDHFNSFNFTTDESSADYEQIAIDPEMLGRVFENLLATIVPETSKAASEKKNKGAFYTPREIVDYMTKQSIIYYLNNYLQTEDDKGIESLINMNDAEYLDRKSTGTADLWGIKSNDTRSKLIEALDNIKILDPACGSGAFPMGLLQLIVKTFDRLGAYYDEILKSHRLIKPSEKNNVYQTKLRIIQHSIYGVDIEPMAAEISRLRSWLSLVLNDEGDIEPLPNLDFNFVCANSLIPLDTSDYQISMFDDFEESINIERIREIFFNVHDKKEKENLKQEYFKLYEKLANVKDGQKRFNQLKTWNPFDVNSNAEFFDPKIMFNIDGFDLVIANPPYVRNERIPKKFKEFLQTKYKSAYDQWSLYIVFFELAINQLKTDGTLCFISPNQWLSTKYGKNLRYMLANNINSLTDFRNYVDFENASVNTFITIANASPILTKIIINVFNENGEKSQNFISREEFVNAKENLGATLSTEISIVNRVKSIFNMTFADKYDVGHSFSIPDFYLLSTIIKENENPDEKQLKLVNTGTLAINGSRWGVKKFKYNKNDYNFPVVEKSDFIKLFPKRKIQSGPKLILSSMGGLNIDIDLDGQFLGTRPTMWLSTTNLDELKISFAILNSRFINWYYQQQYSIAGMDGFKIRYGHINETPFPEIDLVSKKRLIDLVDIIIFSNRNEISLQVDKEINDIIYKLYCIKEEEIRMIEDNI